MYTYDTAITVRSFLDTRTIFSGEPASNSTNNINNKNDIIIKFDKLPCLMFQ